mgnify:CR=1 FL=1
MHTRAREYIKEKRRRKPLQKKELAEMQKTQNLQDIFLNQVRREKQVVTMFLMNGFQMYGTVKGFDGFTVILDSDGKQQLIYKHAISTIVPPKSLELELDT